MPCVDAMFVQQCLVVSEPVIEYLLFDMSRSSLQWARGLKNAFDLVLNTGAAGPLPIALYFPLRTAEACMRRSAQGARRRGS